MERNKYNILPSAWEYMMMLMSRIKSDEELDELKNVISDYFAKRLDEEMDKLWEAGVINEQTIQDWLNGHDRVSSGKENVVA